jgi:YHS domain-containing protein
MSPIRIVILAILLYIGYLLIKGSLGKKKQVHGKKKMDIPANVSDVLMEDPVCKKLVPTKQAVQKQHEGETLYFCSEECYNTFISNLGAKK